MQAPQTTTIREQSEQLAAQNLQLPEGLSQRNTEYISNLAKGYNEQQLADYRNTLQEYASGARNIAGQEVASGALRTNPNATPAQRLEMAATWHRQKQAACDAPVRMDDYLGDLYQNTPGAFPLVGPGADSDATLQSLTAYNRNRRDKYDALAASTAGYIDDLDLVSGAQEAARTAAHRGGLRDARNQRRFGIQQSADIAAHNARLDKFGTALGYSNVSNNARLQEADLKASSRRDMINIGTGVMQDAMVGAGVASTNQASRESANEAASAAAAAQRQQMAAAAVTTMIMVAATVK